MEISSSPRNSYDSERASGAPARFNRVAGRPKKYEFGPWALLLKTLKGLRGTPFDPFGYTAERRMERRLIEDYRSLIAQTVERLSTQQIWRRA